MGTIVDLLFDVLPIKKVLPIWVRRLETYRIWRILPLNPEGIFFFPL